jgi:hypothetical protein
LANVSLTFSFLRFSVWSSVRIHSFTLGVRQRLGVEFQAACCIICTNRRT